MSRDQGDQGDQAIRKVHATRRTPTAHEAAPEHPGDFLADLLARHHVTAHRAGIDSGVGGPGIYQMVSPNGHGGRARRSLSAESAVLLGAYFGIDPLEWLRRQAQWDISQALMSPTLRERLAAIVPLVDASIDTATEPPCHTEVS